MTERGLQPKADLEDHPARLAIESITKVYRLTPAEVRVVHAVVNVGGVR